MNKVMTFANRSSAAVPGCGCGRRLAASSIAWRDVAQASTPAGCGSVPLPVCGRATTRGGTPLKPAAGTATLRGSREDYAAPTALGRIELKIPIKFSTRFGNGQILPAKTVGDDMRSL